MKHVLFDLKQCLITPPLNDEEYVKETLIEAAKIANLELIRVDTHKFDPQGVTALAMLAESHLSIHTWPEKGVAKCDIFTCSDKCKPEKAVEYLGEAFEAEQINSDTFNRLL